MHEVQLGGKTFISVRRASEITGYTRDYLGQLARSGKVDAQRIGRSWYVTVDSLSSHQEKAQEYEPNPPEKLQDFGPDVIVSLDGVEYISSKRASQISQYSQDYVTQMARAGKISSKSVGGRWFVAREQLLHHKKTSDEALAKVQVASVGLVRPALLPEKETKDSELLTYAADDSDLLPKMLAQKPTQPTPLIQRRLGEKSSFLEGGNEFNNIDITATDTPKNSLATKLPVRVISRPQMVVIPTKNRNKVSTDVKSLGILAPTAIVTCAVLSALLIASTIAAPKSASVASLGNLKNTSLTSMVVETVQSFIDTVVGRDISAKNNF
jgi:hypothetical protein